MKVSTENDNNFGYEKITILVDNIIVVMLMTVITVTVISFTPVNMPLKYWKLLLSIK